jgi:CheY-like chemotaxis protein
MSASCVLVVDDDDGIRETLCELVEMAGCSARGAANGVEALKMLADGLPCLVILDLLMPVMGGQELLEAMRRDPSLAAVPVVISTSAPDRAPPGVPVIPKPIDINRMVQWMKSTCDCAVQLPAH